MFCFFRVVFAGVTAGRSRLKAIFIFFLTTFRPIVTVGQYLQKTSTALSDRKNSVEPPTGRLGTQSGNGLSEASRARRSSTPLSTLAIRGVRCSGDSHDFHRGSLVAPEPLVLEICSKSLFSFSFLYLREQYRFLSNPYVACRRLLS